MRLSLKQIMEYQTNGYLIVNNVINEEDLQPLINEINAIIETRGQALYAEGKIKELYPNEPFEKRYALLLEQCPEIGLKMDIMELRGKQMFQFLKNRKLLDIVECLLGSELSCNPIQHLRAKLPVKPGEEEKYSERVLWHQDAGVTLEESEASEIITFWIPLIDVNEQTGCLQLMPDTFKRGYLSHHDDGGTTIVKDLLPQIEPIFCECPKGTIVIMNKYTPHRSFANRSGMIRWSLDLRYHKTGAASGRPSHPSFVVRSKSNPQSVLKDHEEWCQLWEKALQLKIERAHRI